MPGKNTAQRLERMIAPVAAELGYELYDLEFVKEGLNWYLRLFIDNISADRGVTIDDCEAVSRAVEKILDAEDPIPQAYILEVSSPGIDRRLKKERDFIRYAGREVDLKLYKPVNAKKAYRGELIGLENGLIRIKTAGGETGEEIAFERASVASCRLSLPDKW